MKKKVLIIITIIVAILLALGVMYSIDMYMIKHNKPVVFSTWGYSYCPPVNPNEVIPEGYSSFVGTVLEETTTYMIVEPNEDEDERRSADKIRINYGTDHIDYLYGEGRKVLISYTGYIKETYPAQIDTDIISVSGYSDFEITVKESSDIKKEKILNNKDIDDYGSDFDLYYYGLEEVNVNVDNKNMSLEDALRSGKITLDGIVSKANRDLEKQEITGDMYKDGGSMEYHYGTYTIIKRHSLGSNGNISDRDVYIGISEMHITDI